MSDTPTFANLLTQWSTGAALVREGVYAHLRACPAEAHAVEAHIRDELNAPLPARRVLAAEAMLDVYRDEEAAAVALSWVLRQMDAAVTADAVRVVQRMSGRRAVALLDDLAQHATDAFRALTPFAHRWAAGQALGADACETLLRFLLCGDPKTVSALLIGIGGAAPTVEPTADATIEQFIRNRLFTQEHGYAAGGALWRLTWRVHRDWLESINPHSPRFENDPLLLVFLIEVLIEHLGRRPNLTPLVRDLLVRLGTDAPDKFVPLERRLTQLGGRGWAVLLPLLGDPAAHVLARVIVFDEVANRPRVAPLAHHHAHNVIRDRERDRQAVSAELLRAAGGVLTSLGSAAGSALPDVLDLVVKQPDTAPVLAPTLAAIAAGFPNPAAAVARTLDRLRRSNLFAPEAFAVLANVFAGLNLDGALGLVEDTSLDPRTPEAVLQQAPWKAAQPDVRRRHALALAERLGSPRAEVRARTADALRQYPDQMPAVWPALVAVLACGDERAVLLVLPLFRHLGQVADTVTSELRELFREPDPALAARAVVALWRLGRMSVLAPDLRAAVVTARDDSWGWAVLKGVVERVVPPTGLLDELSLVFAAAPQEVAAKVYALLNPPELEEELAIAGHVPRPDDPNAPQTVNWSGVWQCVQNDTEGGLLFLALMCAFGSTGFGAQKIWLIKHQRLTAGTGLAHAKEIVERAVDRLTPTATPGEKHACVQNYFQDRRQAPPKAVTDLLEHRISWYRWAGLELLAAWDASHRVRELIEERIWDRSALVRARALRMNTG